MSRNNRNYRGQQQQVLYVPKEAATTAQEPQQKKISYYVESKKKYSHQRRPYQKEEEIVWNDPDYRRDKEENNGSDDDDSFNDMLEESKEQFDLRQVQQKELTDLLTMLFKQRRISCPICFFNIKGEAKMWNCRQCFQPFHLGCICKWIKNSNKDAANKLFHWSCPKCNLQYSEEMPNYVCFCGKQTDPENNRYSIPHSCEYKCSKKRGRNCPHPCPMDCHPGPCPECNVKGILIKCYCTKNQKQIQCSEDIVSYSCNQICNQMLNCKQHSCQRSCHPGPCQPCSITTLKTCFCGKVSQQVACGQDSFSCNNPCEKMLDCQNHHCTSQKCHQQCQPCLLKPALVSRCPCGKYDLIQIGEARTSCIDPIPTCGTPFIENLGCGHKYKAICGQSNFQCKEKVQQGCRCGKEFRLVDCYQQSEFRCDRVCKKKKSCQVHFCNEECCPATQKKDDKHLCLKLCDKPLPCGNHRCELFCHIGTCQACPIVSNEQLFCFCGKTSKPPPNRCGTKRPECQEICLKALPCDHNCQSSCHNGNCPACLQNVMKNCRCGTDTIEAICSKGQPLCRNVCQKFLPCGHKCLEVCSSGPCKACQQRCGRKRPCGHLCQEACHGNTICPLAPCKTQVQLHCSCGSRDAFMECGLTNEVFQKELKCNQRCSNIKRFGLFYTSTMVDFQKVFYPNVLLKFAHYNQKYLIKLEQRIEEFLLNDEGGSFDLSFAKGEYSDFKKVALQILLARHYKFEVQFAKANKMFLFTIFKREDTIAPKMKLSDYFQKIQKGQIQRDSPFEAKLRSGSSITQNELDQLESFIREYRNDYYIERHPTYTQINFWEEQHAQEVLKRIKKSFPIQWTLEVNKQAIDEKSKISVETNEEVIIKQDQRLKQLREEFQEKAKCVQMCDEIEMESRIEAKDLDIFEQDSFYVFEVCPQREWMIRKFSNPDNLRTPDTLMRTVEFLLEKVVDADHPNSEFKKPLLNMVERSITFEDIWAYMTSRFEIIRQELKQLGWFQEVGLIYEKMIRFHVIGCHELAPFDKVDENLQMLKGLLMEYCEMPCQMKENVMFYCVILKRFEKWDCLSIQELSSEMKQLDCELEMEKYEGITKLFAESSNYLECCMLFKYINSARQKMTFELENQYICDQKESMFLQEYCNALHHRDLKSALGFFGQMGFDVDRTLQEKSQLQEEELHLLQIYFIKVGEPQTLANKKLDKRLSKLCSQRKKLF